MYAESVKKTLKFFNLTTTNTRLMKLTTIVYLNEDFIFAKDQGVYN